MAVFPKQEMDILALANAMIAGYQANPGDFPHADVPAMQAATDDFRNGLLITVCFRAMAKIKTEEKDAALDALVANMTVQLQQSEVDTANDPGKLELIGWGKKTPAQPSNPPNQPRALEAIMQGPGTVFLDWKSPIIGGKGGPVRAYIIYRREQPQGGGAFGNWEQAGMALETKALLTNQSQRRQLEYRIIAVNSAGISIPSNTAAVVL